MSLAEVTHVGRPLQLARRDLGCANGQRRVGRDLFGQLDDLVLKLGKGRAMARLLTPIECARLMGADDYDFSGVSETRALFGFGDAVCVPAIEWIARYYLNPLVNEAVRGKALGKE